MSKGKSCVLYPRVTLPNGKEEDSRLYRELIGKSGFHYPRPITNMLYASYIVSGEKAMEAAVNPDGSPKYKKNRQGQFSAKDYVEFLDFEKSIGEMTSLSEEEYRAGFTDAIGGQRVDFTDAEDALNKAKQFNDNHKGLVASVVSQDTSNGTIYHINVYENNSKSMTLPIGVKDRLQAWDIYKHAFNAVGVDITAMPQELNGIFSAYNTVLADHLDNLSKMDISYFNKRDAWTLFAIDADSQEVKNVVNAFGSIENAAQAIDDFNKRRISLSRSQVTLLQRAIAHAKQLHGIDVDAINSQIDQMQLNNQLSGPEMAIKDELHKLNKKYGIEIEEAKRINDRIDSLSAANNEAIVQLNRKVINLKKLSGNTTETKRLEALIDKLQREASHRRYYNGIIDFLGEAANDAANIDSLLQSIPQTGTERDRIFATAKVLQDIKKIKQQYLYIINALASDNLSIDESMAQVDIDKIKQEAENLGKLFLKKDNEINEITKNLIHDFMVYATNGKMRESDIKDAIEKATIDNVNWAEKFFYGIGTSGNSLINACGTIMRHQEVLRDEAATHFRKKVDVADNKLQKAGYNSKFMYEDQEHIVSDIDWGKYEAAKTAKIKSLKMQGFKGYDFNEKLREWIDNNTEKRVVDKSNGRTELVPDKNYRKTHNFQDGWSQAQIDYYNTVMQYKGELESLYPEYARNLYLPPQVRRNSLDAISSAKSIKDVGKAVKNKLKNGFVIREDDTEYRRNSIDGEYQRAEGDYDNTEKKGVPIYFQKKVESGELMLDFSAALNKEASSAINYDAMENIRDMMELMRDFVADKRAVTSDPKAEVVDSKFQRVIKELYDKTHTTEAAAVLSGFIDQHIYGEWKKEGKYPALSKFFDQIVKYTSFKGLVFNAPGAMANSLTGIRQIFIDANCGEFFGYKDMAWAATKLFGGTGVAGEIMELATNNVYHKGTLMKEFFDPEQEVFDSIKSKRYHSSIFRKLVQHDCSFIGYSSGEYLIHLLPLYAVLHHQKVKLNGKTISLYDAFDVSPIQDGNAHLILKQGVTDLDGNTITLDGNFMKKIKGQITYVNESMHGGMSTYDKGLIHQYVWGRMIMNFRQWMVGHYSRRFRGKHFDWALQDYREGYYTTLWKALINEDTKDTWKAGDKADAVLMLMKDFTTFMFRASTQWSNLDNMQKANIKRVRGEMLTFIALLGLSFVLGEPDDHKKEFWRRWWIYQTKRMIVDTEASKPNLRMINSMITILQAPMAGINTLNSLLYVFWGLQNGDLFDEIKSGEHKGENRYIRNVIKYDLPFFKDWEKIEKLSEDDSMFKVFDPSPSNK